MITGVENEFPFQVDEFYLELQIDGNEISSLSQEQVAAHPFPGLRPFKTSEFQLFRGKDGQAEELIERLKNNHFLAVIGSSGTGKSSLVRAGLIPQLLGGYLGNTENKWKIAICRPGKDPVQNLAVALSYLKTSGTEEKSLLKNFEIIEPLLDENIYGILDVNELLTTEGGQANLLVIIDQFEEIFRFNRTELNKPNIENNFVNLLLKASADVNIPIYVILTMRSEFLGDCIRFKGLPEAINQGQYLVPQLRRNQIKDVIEGPIKLAGKQIDPKLVELLLNELEKKTLKENLDQLPILQHALMITYADAMKEGPDTIIGIEQYKSKEIGGMELALANHAESKYSLLGDQQSNGDNPSLKQNIAKIVFQSLTELGSDAKGGRRPVELKCIYGLAKEMLGVNEEEVNEVIDQFRDEYTSFIMPPINTSLYADLMLDISHESLMRNWGRLKDWIQEDFNSAKNYERLVESASLYKNEKKGLLEGKELENALEWENDFKPNEVWADRYDKAFKSKEYNIGYSDAMAYLSESKKEAERKIREIAEKKSKERKKRIIYSILGLLLIVAVAYLAGLEKQISLHRTYTWSAIANDTLPVDPTKALQIKYSAYNNNNQDLIVDDISNIYQANAFYKTLINGKSTAKHFTSFAVSKSGKYILTGEADGEVTLWPIDKPDHPVRIVNGRSTKGTVYSVEISDDEKYILAGSSGMSTLYDIEKYNDSFKLKKIDVFHQSGKVIRLAFSRENKRFLTGSSDGSVNLYTIGEHEPKKLAPDNGQINCLAFSNKSDVIAVCSSNYTVKYWLTSSVLKNKPAMAFPDEHELFNEKISVTAIAFTPDDKKVVLGLSGASVIYKDVNFSITKPLVMYNNSDRISVYDTQHGAISSIAFLNDANRIIIGSFDNTAEIIDLADFTSILLKGHLAPVLAVGYSPVKKQIYTCSADNTIRTWISQDQDDIITDFYEPNNSIKSATYLNGDTVTTASVSGIWTKKIATWKIYNDNKKSPITQVDDPGDNYPTHSVIISPRSKKFLTINTDNTIGLGYVNNNTINYKFICKKTGHRGQIISAMFSPDEREFLTISNDDTAILWSADGDSLFTFKHNSPVVTASFSTDAKKIITGTLDGKVKIWTSTAAGNGSHWQSQDVRITPQSGIIAVAFFAKSTKFVVCCGNKAIIIGDMNDIKNLASIMQNNNIVAVATSPDGNKFATAHDNGTIKLWKVTVVEKDKQKPFNTYHTGFSNNINSIAFCDNNKILCCYGNKARLLKIETPNVLKKLADNFVDNFPEIEKKLPEE